MSLFYPETLPPQTAELVSLLHERSPAFLSTFYLSGGTGLSLQIGHRESEDLDFFAQHTFRPQALEKELQAFGELHQTQLEEGTLNTFLEKVKLQFLEYPYPLLEPFVDWNGILLSSVLDIACTKLQTISMRGSKKDFVDLYFLLQKYSLPELLDATRKKYQHSNYSQAHILKSLVYFVDAEGQPMPRLHLPIEWEGVKEKMIQEVKALPLA